MQTCIARIYAEQFNENYSYLNIVHRYIAVDTFVGIKFYAIAKYSSESIAHYNIVLLFIYQIKVCITKLLPEINFIFGGIML